MQSTPTFSNKMMQIRQWCSRTPWKDPTYPQGYAYPRLKTPGLDATRGCLQTHWARLPTSPKLDWHITPSIPPATLEFTPLFCPLPENWPPLPQFFKGLPFVEGSTEGREVISHLWKDLRKAVRLSHICGRIYGRPWGYLTFVEGSTEGREVISHLWKDLRKAVRLSHICGRIYGRPWGYLTFVEGSTEGREVISHLWKDLWKAVRLSHICGRIYGRPWGYLTFVEGSTEGREVISHLWKDLWKAVRLTNQVNESIEPLICIKI